MHLNALTSDPWKWKLETKSFCRRFWSWFPTSVKASWAKSSISRVLQQQPWTSVVFKIDDKRLHTCDPCYTFLKLWNCENYGSKLLLKNSSLNKLTQKNYVVWFLVYKLVSLYVCKPTAYNLLAWHSYYYMWPDVWLLVQMLNWRH